MNSCRCIGVVLLLALFICQDSLSSAQIKFKSGDISLDDFEPIKQIPSRKIIRNDMGHEGLFVLASVSGDVQLDSELEGLTLLQYLPHDAYYAWIRKDAHIKNIAEGGVELYEILPRWKIDPILFHDSMWFHAVADSLDVKIFAFEYSIQKDFEELGYDIHYRDELNSSFTVRISKNDLYEIAGMNEVVFIEPIQPNPETNNLVERTNHRVPMVEKGSGLFNLSGKGVAVGEWDGSGADLHIDYDFRHKQMEPFTNNSNGRHATHVAGTVLGGGIIDPNARGMAPEALLYSYNFNGNIPAEMDTCAQNFDIRLTQNSYSYGGSGDPCSRRGTYDGTSVALDRVVNKYPHLLHVFAAGNSRSSNCLSGGYGTVHSGFQASKNSLAVAAVTSTDGNSSFHSYGPTQDGRLKPEISAVGVSVYSTFPSNTYRGGYSGTSMACPGVSGTGALIHELYVNKYKSKMPAHLLKGVLCNGADELGRPGPDFQYGFGRINARRSADIVNNKYFVLDSVQNGSTYIDTIFLSGFPLELKVMLCWNDPEASSSSSVALVNDLDLELYDSAGNLYAPWVLDAVSYTKNAARGRDSLNNIEQVTIAAPSSGYFIVKVKGARITKGYQAFSVNWLIQDTGIFVTYPNGNEKWLPPNSSANAQMIRWDSYGLAGSTKVEFSSDSGSSWSTLSNAVNASNSYYSWSNASASLRTSEALIRITKNSVQDQSDKVFHIGLNGPSPSVVACDQQLHVTWSKVANAASYNVYMLDSGLMKLQGNTADLFFTIRNLANGVDHWIAISAVDANGAEGQRSDGVKFRTDATKTPIKILSDLQDKGLCAGNTGASINVNASGGVIAYLWEYSIDNGKSWTDNKLNLSSFSLGTVKLTDNRKLFRVKMVNPVCKDTVRSRIAILRVDTSVKYFITPTKIDMCLGQDTVIKTQLKASNPPVYTWSWRQKPTDSWTDLKTNDSSYSIQDAKSYHAGFYRVEVTNNCPTIQLPAEMRLNVNPQLTLKVNPDDFVCVGASFELKATASGGDKNNYSYSWSNLSTIIPSNTHTIFPSEDQIWTASVFDNCSKDTIKESVSITMRDTLRVELGPDITICQGQEANLNALTSGGVNNQYKYTWSNAATDAARIKVFPRTNTYYYVTVSDDCSKEDAIDSIRVVVRDPLHVQIETSVDTPCFGQLIDLNIVHTGGYFPSHTVVWADGAKWFERKVTLTSDTTFTVRLEDGCSDRFAFDTLKLSVRNPLDVKITGLDTACSGQMVTYQALVSGGDPNNYRYFWNGQEGSDSFRTIPESINPIQLRVEDNCTSLADVDEKRIVIREPLRAAMLLSDYIICLGQSIDIGIQPLGGDSENYEIEWETKEHTASINVKPDTTTNYGFVLKDHCSVPDIKGSIEVKVRPALRLDLGDDLQKCADDVVSVNLIGQGGLNLNYAFEVNGTRIQGKQLVMDDKATKMYVVRLLDDCSVEPASDTLTMKVEPLNAFTFELASRKGTTTTFKSNSSNNEVLWNWGDGFSSNDPGANVGHSYTDYGTYEVCKTETDNIGCSEMYCYPLDLYDPMQSSGIQVLVYPNPTTELIYVNTSKISGRFTLELVDAKADLVWRTQGENDSETTYQLDMSPFANGIYFLKTILNDEVMNFKIVKSE